MIYNVDSLRKETVTLIKEINEQIVMIKKQETNEADQAGSPRDSAWWGRTNLAHLLQAKATAYNTLVMLQTNASGTSASRRS